MTRYLLLIFIGLLPNITFAWDKIDCEFVGGDTKEILVQSIHIRVTGLNKADLVIETSQGVQTYQEVDCKKETTPEHLFSCEHDQFIFITSLDEDPMPAALNPFLYQGRQFGPFYFACYRG